MTCRGRIPEAVMSHVGGVHPWDWSDLLCLHLLLLPHVEWHGRGRVRTGLKVVRERGVWQLVVVAGEGVA